MPWPWLIVVAMSLVIPYFIPIAPVQYTSAALSKWAESHDVRLSVGKDGVSWDNAVTESFFSTLKLHLLYERKQFQSKLEARTGGCEWTEPYHNRRRSHTSTAKIPKQAIDDFLPPPSTTAAQAAYPPSQRVSPSTKLETAKRC